MFREDSILMTDFRAEVWNWVVQSASTFSASTLDIGCFQALTQEQRFDLAARYMAELGIDGDSMVSAQGASFLISLKLGNLQNTVDQSGQKLEEPEMLELPIKEVVSSIMESSATDRVINALNMPSSASHPDMDIYR
jgi:hypothetical protein